MRLAVHRTLEEIADQAVKVINPPASSKELCGARVSYCIRELQEFGYDKRKWVSPAKRREKLDDYIKLFRAARKAASAEGDEQKLLAALDQSIRRAEARRSGVIVKAGSRPRNYHDDSRLAQMVLPEL